VEKKKKEPGYDILLQKTPCNADPRRVGNATRGLELGAHKRGRKVQNCGRSMVSRDLGAIFVCLFHCGCASLAL
jgi:hypothetical protein